MMIKILSEMSKQVPETGQNRWEMINVNELRNQAIEIIREIDKATDEAWDSENKGWKENTIGKDFKLEIGTEIFGDLTEVWAIRKWLVFFYSIKDDEVENETRTD